MSAAVIKRFDLYDSFSVLLPGVGLLVGLYPLFPSGLRLDTLGAVLLFLVLSFFVGRAFHVLAANYERGDGRQTHRQAFQTELLENVLVDAGVAKQFYRGCRNEFGELELEDFEDREQNPVATLDALYSLVRGYVHIDARGRSRTFQAIFAFYRSVQWEALVLTAVYLAYGVLFGTITVVGVGARLLGRQSDWLLDPGILPYATKMELLGVPPGLMVLGMIALSALAYKIFRSATDEYQDHYIQYLITDFLVLRYSTVDSDGALAPPSSEKDDADTTPRTE